MNLIHPEGGDTEGGDTGWRYVTGPKVELDCSINAAFVFNNKRLIICPEKMIPEIKEHFDKYCQDLRDPKNKTLRVNFEKRLKFVWGVKL